MKSWNVALGLILGVLLPATIHAQTPRHWTELIAHATNNPRWSPDSVLGRLGLGIVPPILSRQLAIILTEISLEQWTDPALHRFLVQYVLSSNYVPGGYGASELDRIMTARIAWARQRDPRLVDIWRPRSSTRLASRIARKFFYGLRDVGIQPEPPQNPRARRSAEDWVERATQEEFSEHLLQSSLETVVSQFWSLDSGVTASVSFFDRMIPVLQQRPDFRRRLFTAIGPDHQLYPVWILFPEFHDQIRALASERPADFVISFRRFHDRGIGLGLGLQLIRGFPLSWILENGGFLPGSVLDRYGHLHPEIREELSRRFPTLAWREEIDAGAMVSRQRSIRTLIHEGIRYGGLPDLRLFQGAGPLELPREFFPSRHPVSVENFSNYLFYSPDTGTRNPFDRDIRVDAQSPVGNHFQRGLQRGIETGYETRTRILNEGARLLRESGYVVNPFADLARSLELFVNRAPPSLEEQDHRPRSPAEVDRLVREEMNRLFPEVTRASAEAEALRNPSHYEFWSWMERETRRRIEFQIAERPSVRRQREAWRRIHSPTPEILAAMRLWQARSREALLSQFRRNLEIARSELEASGFVIQYLGEEERLPRYDSRIQISEVGELTLEDGQMLEGIRIPSLFHGTSHFAIESQLLTTGPPQTRMELARRAALLDGVQLMISNFRLAFQTLASPVVEPIPLLNLYRWGVDERSPRPGYTFANRFFYSMEGDSGHAQSLLNWAEVGQNPNALREIRARNASEGRPFPPQTYEAQGSPTGELVTNLARETMGIVGNTVRNLPLSSRILAATVVTALGMQVVRPEIRESIQRHLPVPQLLERSLSTSFSTSGISHPTLENPGRPRGPRSAGSRLFQITSTSTGGHAPRFFNLGYPPEFVDQPTRVLSAHSSAASAGANLLVRSIAPLEVDSSRIGLILRPEGEQLQDLNVTVSPDGRSLRPGVDYIVLQNQRTHDLAVRLLIPGVSSIRYEARFRPAPPGSFEAEEADRIRQRQRAEAVTLHPGRFRQTAERLDDAHFTVLNAEVGTQGRASQTALHLFDSLRSANRYSYRRPAPPPPATTQEYRQNPYLAYSALLDEGGRFCAVCGGHNLLGTQILNDSLLPSEYRAEVRTTFVYDGRSGYLTPDRAHARTFLFSQRGGQTRGVPIILDATPGIYDGPLGPREDPLGPQPTTPGHREQTARNLLYTWFISREGELRDLRTALALRESERRGPELRDPPPSEDTSPVAEESQTSPTTEAEAQRTDERLPAERAREMAQRAYEFSNRIRRHDHTILSRMRQVQGRLRLPPDPTEPIRRLRRLAQLVEDSFQGRILPVELYSQLHTLYPGVEISSPGPGVTAWQYLAPLLPERIATERRALEAASRRAAARRPGPRWSSNYRDYTLMEELNALALALHEGAQKVTPLQVRAFQEVRDHQPEAHTRFYSSLDPVPDSSSREAQAQEGQCDLRRSFYDVIQGLR